MSITIPAQESDFTTEWLTGALGCDRNEVKFVKARAPADTIGLTSQIYFLDVAATPGSPIPAKLVVKVASRSDATAEVMRSYQTFSRETYFYTRIARHLPVRTPRFLFGWTDPVTEAGVLLLEDCSHFETRDNTVPIPTSETELFAGIETLARVAAASRDAKWLDHPLAFGPGRVAWSKYLTDVQSDWGALTRREDMTRYLAPGFDQLALRLAERMHTLIDSAWPKQKLSLVHVDYHPGNWFVDRDNPQDPLIIFDWQSWGAGPTIVDLAYLLCVSYTVEYRRAVEDRAIRHFLATLAALGVDDYDEAAARADYELGLLLSMRLPPMFVNMLDPSNPVAARMATKTLHNLSTAAMDHGGHAWLDRVEARGGSPTPVL